MGPAFTTFRADKAVWKVASKSNVKSIATHDNADTSLQPDELESGKV